VVSTPRRGARPFLFNAGLEVLCEFAQLLARLGQGQIGLLLGDAGAVGFDGQHGRRGQAGQVALEQVIVGAVAHGLNGDVLADLARHQDEGHELAGGAHLVQRRQA